VVVVWVLGGRVVSRLGIEDRESCEVVVGWSCWMRD
jgi:hypothetical protein